MSDETNTETTAQPALAPADVTTTPDAPVEVTETEAKADATQAKPEGEAPEAKPDTDETTEDPKKRPSGSERLKRNLARVSAEAEAMAQELESYRRRESDGGAKQGKPGVDRAPTEADYPGDYLAFERADRLWSTRAIIREEMGRGEQQRRQQVLHESRQERLEAYHDNAEKVRERIPDFDKVIAAANGLNVSPAVAEEIMSSEKAALLQYHLAGQPDKVRELNGMSRVEVAREIGRLEARVHLPKPNTQTRATPPPTQINGGAAPAFNPATADMDQFAPWLKKDLARRSGRA